MGHIRVSRLTVSDVKTPGLWYTQVVSVKDTLFNSYDLFCPWTAPRNGSLLIFSWLLMPLGIKFSVLRA